MESYDKNLSGIIQKYNKKKMFSSYEDRYFKIFDGAYLAYFDKKQLKKERKQGEATYEDDFLKGVLEIFDISDVVDNKKNEFKIVYGSNDISLKTTTIEDKNTWMRTIIGLRDQLRAENPEREVQERSWKVNELSQDCFCALDSLGVLNQEGRKESVRLLNLKGIQINTKGLSERDIKCRMAHCFASVNEKQSWIFLISSRPLNQKDYYEKELQLESNALPSWCAFDTLYVSETEDKDKTANFNESYSLQLSFKQALQRNFSLRGRQAVLNKN